MKLVIEVEIQSYGGDEEEKQALEQIRETLVHVLALPEISVGTFVKTEVKGGST